MAAGAGRREGARRWVSGSQRNLESLSCLYLISSFSWKLQRKFAELSRLGPDLDPPVTVLNDAIADGKAQAHAFADVFGGVKRIKYFIEVFLSNPGPIVSHHEEAAVSLGPAFNPDGRLFVGEGLVFQG